MGLFDMFKKKAEPAAAAAPASISASAGADVLCSPVKGKVIKMADVPDPVFGGEVLGKGCAVWPEDDLVYAPCDGKVTVTMGHAVGLQSDSGIEVLVHVGVDTVNMNGDGSRSTAPRSLLPVTRTASSWPCPTPPSLPMSNSPSRPTPLSPPVTPSLRSSASKLRHPKDVQGWSGFPATFFIAPRESVLLHVGRACKPFGR